MAKKISPQAKATRSAKQSVKKTKLNPVPPPHRLQPAPAPPKVGRVPSAWSLTRMAVRPLTKHWKLFGGIVLLYGILNLIFVQSLGSSADIQAVTSALDKHFKGGVGKVGSGLSAFAYLLGASAGTSQGGAYQSIIVIVVSLSLIWVLRREGALAEVRVRDAFYRAMTPLVPFALILCIIALQLAPFLLGAGLYNTAVSNGIADATVVRLVFLLLFGLLAFWSLYMVSGSIMSMYIVTLPEMTPFAAFRSSRALARRRRWMVMRKLLFLPIVLLVPTAIIMLPILMFATALAPWIFFALTMIALAVFHSYMYTLYQALL